MSYKSKKTITNMTTGILFICAYVIYALNKNWSDPYALKFFATAILVFFGILVVTMVVTQIIFYILLTIGMAIKEQKCDEKNVEKILLSSMVADEMDKLIKLKSCYVGYICTCIGFITALIALAFGLSAVFSLHILFGSFALGAIMSGCINVYCYERGIRNTNE